MSSSTKQDKRAKRARAKARQQRIQRNSGSGPAIDDSALEDDFFLSDDLLEEVIEQFEILQIAESVSLEQLLTTLLREPMLEMASTSGSNLETDLDQACEHMIHRLSLYWKWSQGLDPDATLERVGTPEFQAALAGASQRVEEEMQAALRTLHAHYRALEAAEAVSQVEMFKVLLKGPMMPDSEQMEKETDDEYVSNELVTALVSYWKWSQDLDVDAISARLSSPQLFKALHDAVDSLNGEHPSLPD